jgi:hypothetical protein
MKNKFDVVEEQFSNIGGDPISSIVSGLVGGTLGALNPTQTGDIGSICGQRPLSSSLSPEATKAWDDCAARLQNAEIQGVVNKSQVQAPPSTKMSTGLIVGLSLGGVLLITLLVVALKPKTPVIIQAAPTV